VVQVATLILAGRECPWTCLECDLWRGTLVGPAPQGALPAQVERALSDLPSARQVKLYNAGSLFDPRAVPPADLAPLADLVRGFDRVAVECHPRLVGETAVAFRDRLGGRLEVAMGLETADDRTLALLNKGMKVEHFVGATRWLVERDIDVRAFVLVRPPFVSEAAGIEQARRSIDLVLDEGGRVVALIPTRGGNGAMEALAAAGDFAPPSLAALEAAVEHGLARGDGIVLADLWELERHHGAEIAFEARRDRLEQMNRMQQLLPPVCP
jgi:radical SAM enzyme (TIGR01210 family)